ncbi:hypothetical protein BS78_02G095200 [Paspalum vaginatum]|nr:hypothetical protein BS78_02G095200 [Paspalum vaginatum]
MALLQEGEKDGNVSQSIMTTSVNDVFVIAAPAITDSPTMISFSCEVSDAIDQNHPRILLGSISNSMQAGRSLKAHANDCGSFAVNEEKDKMGVADLMPRKTSVEIVGHNEEKVKLVKEEGMNLEENIKIVNDVPVFPGANMSKPRTALFQGEKDDEPMAPLIIHAKSYGGNSKVITGEFLKAQPVFQFGSFSTYEKYSKKMETLFSPMGLKTKISFKGSGLLQK